MDGGDEMIHGLSEEEKFKVITELNQIIQNRVLNL